MTRAPKQHSLRGREPFNRRQIRAHSCNSRKTPSSRHNSFAEAKSPTPANSGQIRLNPTNSELKKLKIYPDHRLRRLSVHLSPSRIRFTCRARAIRRRVCVPLRLNLCPETKKLPNEPIWEFPNSPATTTIFASNPFWTR